MGSMHGHKESLMRRMQINLTKQRATYYISHISRQNVVFLHRRRQISSFSGGYRDEDGSMRHGRSIMLLANGRILCSDKRSREECKIIP